MENGELSCNLIVYLLVAVGQAVKKNLCTPPHFFKAVHWSRFGAFARSILAPEPYICPKAQMTYNVI